MWIFMTLEEYVEYGRYITHSVHITCMCNEGSNFNKDGEILLSNLEHYTGSI